MSTKIILADSHRITREGLYSMINSQPNMEVVAEADNGRKAVELAQKCSPDIVIMAVNLPKMNGVEATLRITSMSSRIRVIGLSTQTDKRIVQRMLQAGASGYLLKSCGFDELLRAIRAVVKGQFYLSPEVAGYLVKALSFRKTDIDNMDTYSILTGREREILQLIAEGLKTRTIADTLYVSVKTVETHRRQLMGKLNLHSVAQLTKYAISEGMTSIELR